MRVPFKLPLLTGEHFREKANKRPNRKVGGADGWLTPEMKKIPAETFQLFAEICNITEADPNKQWPRILCFCPSSLIPKEVDGVAVDVPAPLEERPITAM